MNILTKITCIKDFFNWLDENSYAELTEYVQSSYGDGDDYHHVVDTESIIDQYKNYLDEVG